MTLKLAAAGAGSVAAVAGRALVTLVALPPLVVLAQPAASTAGTAIAASASSSPLDAIMTMRRVPTHRGSRSRLRPEAGATEARVMVICHLTGSVACFADFIRHAVADHAAQFVARLQSLLRIALRHTSSLGD